MLDSDAREDRASSPTTCKAVEFYTIELAPLRDGQVYVAITATTVDDEEPQLLNQEIERRIVATMDDALALIRARANV